MPLVETDRLVPPVRLGLGAYADPPDSLGTPVEQVPPDLVVSAVSLVQPDPLVHPALPERRVRPARWRRRFRARLGSWLRI